MMGHSPREIDRMTIAKFQAAARGFRDFHTPADTADAPTADEYWAAREAFERSQGG